RNAQGLRWSRTIASGRVVSPTAGVACSSPSIAASRAVRFSPRADTIPASMLSPLALDATGPTVDRAAESILVVVDLPFVPVTNTLRRPAASWDIRPGSTLRATSPPIIPPDPRPDTRDAHVARPPTAVATRPRTVSAVGGGAPVVRPWGGCGSEETGPGCAREDMRRV